jgi:membrane protein
MRTASSRGGRAVARCKEVARAVVVEVRSENITFMAGSIAYHAFVSLLPFLLLVLFLLTTIGSEALATRLIEALVANITPASTAAGDSARSIADVLVLAARNATENAGLSLLSIAALVWGTLRIFRGLDQAFSDIYESEAANTFLDQLFDAVAVFGAIVLALFAVTFADTFVEIPSYGPATVVVRPVLSVLAVCAALLPMFYVFPDEDVTLREVLPGTLVAATGWTLLSVGFQLYAVSTSNTSYGIVGVIILLITWLYFGGLVLLFGAAVNAVLSGRSEDVEDIAWEQAPGCDPTENDATLVAPLEDLEGSFDDGTVVRIASGDGTVELPPPDEARVTVTTVERPDVLGGSRESGEIVLRWDSRA